MSDKPATEIHNSETRTDSSSSNIKKVENDMIIQSEELISKIPLYNDDVNVTKESDEGNFLIEKKWVTTTKKIEIPVRYQEIFINGKELDSYDQHEIVEILSKIKTKLNDVFLHEKGYTQAGPEGNEIVYSDIELINSNKNTDKPKNNILTQKLIPLENVLSKTQQKENDVFLELYGEEIIITKRMTKLGQIKLNKYEINSKENLDIDMKREKLTIKFPGNHKEEII